MAKLAKKWAASDSLGGTVLVEEEGDPATPICRVPAYRDNKQEVGRLISAVPDLMDLSRAVVAGRPRPELLRLARSALARAEGLPQTESRHACANEKK